MENWTAVEWIKAMSCILILIAAATKLAIGRLRSHNVAAIRVLLTMIEEDRKEFCREELDGAEITEEVKNDLLALKKSASDLYLINKRDRNSIRVHKLIEQYHTQLVNLELSAMKVGEFKTFPKGVVRRIT